MITIIELVLKNKLNKEEKETLVKDLKSGGGQMLAVLEMLVEENKSFFRKCKKEGKLEKAKKLLEEKVSMDIIMKATELTEKEIKKLAKS